ncbi:hypothetical protein BDW69DRAFT_179485 [Aspergillus filifer]
MSCPVTPTYIRYFRQILLIGCTLVSAIAWMLHLHAVQAPVHSLARSAQSSPVCRFVRREGRSRLEAQLLRAGVAVAVADSTGRAVAFTSLTPLPGGFRSLWAVACDGRDRL